MAGTDSTKCSQCGEGWYDRPDRVGTVCPECWFDNQLIEAAAAAQDAADKARQDIADRRAERKQAADASKGDKTAPDRKPMKAGV